MLSLLWITQLATTWFMTGLIWLIQLVHYPLFKQVGGAEFIRYHHAHTRQITFIVMPMMTLELLSALALALYPAPKLWPSWAAWLGLALVGIAWLTTAMLSVPAHQALSAGFDLTAHHQLTTTNWLRTLAWSARGLLLAWFTLRILNACLGQPQSTP